MSSLVELAKASTALGHAEVVLFVAVLFRVAGGAIVIAAIEVGVRDGTVEAGDAGRGADYGSMGARNVESKAEMGHTRVMGETLLHRGAALGHVASVSRAGLLGVLLVSIASG